MKMFILISILYLLSGYLFAQNYWTIISTPRSRYLNDIIVHNQMEISVVGGNPVNDSISYMGYTQDGGDYWDGFTDIFPGKMIKAAVFTNSENGICAGYNESLFVSSNSGETWTSKSFNIELNNRNTNSLHKTGPNKVYAAGGLNNENGFLIKTTDGANSWGFISEWTDNEIIDFAAIDNQNFVVCGNDNFIQYSYNSGSTWNPSILNSISANYSLRSICFLNAQNGLCAGGIVGADSISLILRTTDGGINWTPVHKITNPCLNDICYVNADTAYAVGDYGTVLISVDGGITWNDCLIPDNPEVDLLAVYFKDTHLGAICGKSGKVLFYNDGYYDKIDNVFELGLSIYPNPFDEFLILSIETEYSQIDICDLNGRVVLSKLSDRNDVNINTNQLKAGIYELRIYTKNQLSTRKIVKIKP